ncbi:MAG TPA: LacI family DNA-binding transcriptional regulator [Mycobacteriales bacterium]|nr:LacI family DNA-binding transcriptional regulator [Mycobacteriales bacterium]
MSVTSADVARAAGVSRATVSYVLNDAPGKVVSTETRAAVLRVAQELGYQPSALARSLKRGRSNTVLFPSPHVEMNHVLSSLIDACTAALAPRGFSLVSDVSRHHDPAAQADAWAEIAPAALLDLNLHHDDEALVLLRARGIPVLSAALPQQDPWESSGDIFARLQRLEQLRFLIARGHRRIRWIMPTLLPVDPRTERRLLSEARSLVAEADGRLELERIDLPDVAAAVAEWSTMPDAVATHNDTFAIATMTALQHRGVRIPDDVAVIGLDDEPLASVVTPSLTTIAGDFTDFAAAVADGVEAVLANQPAGALPVPPLRLLERASA